MSKQITIEEVLGRDDQFLKELVAERIMSDRPDCVVILNEDGFMCKAEDAEYVNGMVEKTKELVAEVVQLGLLLGMPVQYDEDYDPRDVFDRIIEQATPLFEV